MKYYIQLENLTVFFRFKNSGEWKKIPFSEVNNTFEDDFLTTNVRELKNLVTDDTEITIDNETWIINPSHWSFNDRNVILHKEIYIKRDQFPIIPDINQLVDVIRNGNDRVNNSLILNLDGKFELFENFINNKDQNVVVRNETYIANNKYVGKEPSNDLIFINNIYLTMLKGWYSHLITNKINIYVDTYITDDTIEGLREKIHLLEENFLL